MKDKRRTITKDDWSQIKGKYVSGKKTVTQIAEEHKISRKSIQRKAKKEGWEYGSSKDEVAKAIQAATIETITREDTDRAVNFTDKFLNDSEKVRNLTMAIVDGMQNALANHGGNIPADEANRLLSCQRANEVSMRTVTGIYAGQRKALGLDAEQDIEKARKIKQADKHENPDPCVDETEESVDKKLKELE